MTTPANPFTLVQWRRAVAELYAAVRNAPSNEALQAWEAFRLGRDALFKEHPDSPLSQQDRAVFGGLETYPYNPGWRKVGRIDRKVDPQVLKVDLGADGLLQYTRVGRVHFEVEREDVVLSLYWIDGYGGGLFLPFLDQTGGVGTYGGGRYLYDTIKGADLGVQGASMIMDFNYAFNPSCAYNEHWICPLPQPENRLSVPIEAGEKAFTRSFPLNGG